MVLTFPQLSVPPVTGQAGRKTCHLLLIQMDIWVSKLGICSNDPALSKGLGGNQAFFSLAFAQYSSHNIRKVFYEGGCRERRLGTGLVINKT